MEALAPYSLEFEKVLAQNHLECEPVFRLESADTARRIVEHGDFLSVLPLYTVKAAADAGRLTVLNVPEWAHQQSIQLVLHRSKVVTPQIDGLLEEMAAALDAALADRL